VYGEKVSQYSQDRIKMALERHDALNKAHKLKADIYAADMFHKNTKKNETEVRLKSGYEQYQQQQRQMTLKRSKEQHLRGKRANEQTIQHRHSSQAIK
jgi:hypothetical protein